jgi:hypothetical protein
MASMKVSHRWLRRRRNFAWQTLFRHKWHIRRLWGAGKLRADDVLGGS